MCGIAGYIAKQNRTVSEDILHRMHESIAYRGPDDHGLWINEQKTVGLVHRRLSIIDLSSAARGPMVSQSGRYTITFNGEIYNYRIIREQLKKEGYGFKTGSDTEVLLTAIESWGILPALKQCVGMFAFALWDNKQHCLLLARDRLGIKPLYYSLQKGCFAFASEMKPFFMLDDFDYSLSQESINRYFQFGYVSGENSIFNSVKKLSPGTILCYSPGKSDYHIEAFWCHHDVAKQGIENLDRRDTKTVIDELHSLLQDAVKLRMIADVPIGVFLSGGVDSSLIAAVMQAQSAQKINTFTIGFKEAQFDEAQYAKKIAEQLGTHHTEYYLSEQEALSVIETLPQVYDEPFADISQIPTILVSKVARKEVTVVLSGDGGDELFAGYNNYWRVLRRWQQVAWCPIVFRVMVASLLERMPQLLLNERFQRLIKLLKAADFPKAYQIINSEWQFSASLLANPSTTHYYQSPEFIKHPIQKVAYSDIQGYLVDDILTKVDRASMSVGLEARIPLLDHRIVEYSWRLPFCYRKQQGQSKWILREILKNYLPKHTLNPIKQGFVFPIDDWLRGPLRDLANETFQDTSTSSFINETYLQKTWKDHQKGVANKGIELWRVLMFKMWMKKYR